MSRRRFELDCTVRVSHTFDDLSAHVELDGNIAIYPGDEVRVHGRALNPPYGAVQVERRRATVTRASMLERWWAKTTGNLDCLTLFDFGFAEERAP